MEKLAKMAMLDTADTERLMVDVDKMLAMAEDLKEVEVTEVLAHTAMALRDDEIEAECFEGGYIVVPKVVGE